MKKAFFEMTNAERKEALAEEKRQKEAFLKEIISPERQAADQEAQRVQAEALAAEKEAQFRQSVLDSYIAANGSDHGFNDAWPSLRAELVKQRTIANVGNAATSPDPVTRFIERVNTR
jgi:hypothetical protein